MRILCTGLPEYQLTLAVSGNWGPIANALPCVADSHDVRRVGNNLFADIKGVDLTRGGQRTVGSTLA